MKFVGLLRCVRALSPSLSLSLCHPNYSHLGSGGKDSCHALLHCIAMGHELVALANLQPEPSKGFFFPSAPAVPYVSALIAADDRMADELDSYMYQTVGHEIVPAIAAAIGVPLIRQTIVGSSKDICHTYTATEGDEVEDLFLLLSRVREEFPEITAVCSGAILSDYQRVRVEHVCGRLGLTSFAYLWQRSQPELLDEMIACGLEAVLIKVRVARLICLFAVQ
jgi:diphthine-ammonia ligase